MPRKHKLKKLSPDSVTILFLGWRRHRKLDVYSHIEEELLSDEANTVEAFIEWLKAHPEEKTGRDYLDATLAKFYKEADVR